MENIETRKVPFEEQKLTELLDYACDQLHPTTGYRLELDGISPDKVTLKELEAKSGYSFDPLKGAKIDFIYDEDDGQLVLNTLRHPLAGQSDLWFTLSRTTNSHHQLQYIGFLESGTAVPSPSDVEWQHTLDTEFISRVLAGYGVPYIPHPDHESYQLWRANLMSQCENGWTVYEYARLFLDMTESTTKSIELSSTQSLSNEGEVSVIKTLSSNYDLTDGSGEFAQYLSSTAVTMTNTYGTTLRLRQESVDVKLDPFTINDPGEVVHSTSTAIPLTHDSFNNFKRTIDDTIHYLKESGK
jgi:hypothetical protein